MRIDYMIMNPPYNRNLHLKFLERTLEEADNVVSVQPVSWFTNCIAKYNKNSNYNKYEDSILKKIKTVDFYERHDSEKVFNIRLISDIGIYKSDNNGGFDYKKYAYNSLIDRVLPYIKNNKCHIDHNKKDGIRAKINKVQGPKHNKSLNCLHTKDIVFKDGKYGGKWWYEYWRQNQHSKTTEYLPASIEFDTEDAAHNFLRSTKTDFYCYIEHHIIISHAITEDKILWMGNAKNPRTSKIGYKSEWIDEDFEQFFNLSEEEVKRYKDFMNKYRQNETN